MNIHLTSRARQGRLHVLRGFSGLLNDVPRMLVHAEEAHRDFKLDVAGLHPMFYCRSVGRLVVLLRPSVRGTGLWGVHWGFQGSFWTLIAQKLDLITQTSLQMMTELQWSSSIDCADT